MKSFKLVFSAAFASILAACSSMDVSEAEAYSENYPADFSEAAYMQVHPELVRIQRLDYVTGYNNSLKTNPDYETAKANDSIAFAQTDTAILHQMLVDPFVGGFTEEDWALDWQSGERDSVVRTYKLDTLSLSVGDSTDLTNRQSIVLGLKADSAAKMFGSIEYDADGTTIKAIHGYSKCETTCSSEDTLDIVMSATNFIRKITPADTMSSILTSEKKTIMVLGEISSEHWTALRKLNLIGTNDDYALLKALPIDSLAIGYQFVMYGRSHGWAYRPCTDLEKSHPVRTESYPATKLYCDDNGIAKEI